MTRVRMVENQRIRSRTGLLAGVLTVVLLSVGLAWTSPVAAAELPPGTILVTRTATGDVAALAADGSVEVLATGLGQPQSLAVLADGTMLTVDFPNNRIMGFGGRLGAAPVVVAEVPQPSGLTVGTDGSVYLTSIDGQLYRVDVDGRGVVPFASGLQFPGIPAERGGQVFVPQAAFGDVVAVSTADGSITPTTVAGAGTLVATATADGLPLFVADAVGGRVLKVDPATGDVTTFVVLTGPGQLVLDRTPRKGQPWSLLIATPTAVVRVDTGGGVLERLPIEGTISGLSVATVPISTSEAPPAEAPTTVLKDETEGAGGGFPTMLIVVLVIVALAAIVTVFVFQRSSLRERGADWFKNPPAPPDPPRAASHRPPPPSDGLPSGEKPEISPQEAELNSVRSQLVGLTQEAATLAQRAGVFRELVARALEARSSARIKRERAALIGAVHDVAPLTAESLDLVTDQGREAFDAHRQGQITDAKLRERWSELGETRALEQVFRYGEELDRADLSTPSPEERRAAREAFDAREQLIGVEARQAEVSTEIARLHGLESELNRQAIPGAGEPPRPGTF